MYAEPTPSSCTGQYKYALADDSCIFVTLLSDIYASVFSSFLCTLNKQKPRMITREVQSHYGVEKRHPR